MGPCTCLPKGELEESRLTISVGLVVGAAPLDLCNLTRSSTTLSTPTVERSVLSLLKQTVATCVGCTLTTGCITPRAGAHQDGCPSGRLKKTLAPVLAHFVPFCDMVRIPAGLGGGNCARLYTRVVLKSTAIRRSQYPYLSCSLVLPPARYT